MPSIVFRFPTGRYHATPWANHVNEGLVEWPPSPWRIVRTLLATGFSKLGWAEVPEVARQLVERLSASLPDYRLPPAIAAHTRHFMPTDSRKPEDKTKVFDAFARLGKNAELAVTWSIELSTSAGALLSELVPKISYLGRAESIVDARIAGDADLPAGYLASAGEENQRGLEPIALLAPMTAEAYALWLTRAAQPQWKARAKRTKPVSADPFPPDPLAALLADTAFLQEHGWTQPPGSRRVHYYRPPLSTSPQRAVSRPTVLAADTALLALASDTRNGDVLPRVSRSLAQAELLHRALASKVNGAACPELTGLDASGTRLKGHRHASLVPLDIDGDGYIDHILVHSPMGLGAHAQRALRCLRQTYTKGADKPLFVTLVGLGMLADFRRVGNRIVPELNEARVWVSRTPFVPPRHLKAKRHTLEDQVKAELMTRGFLPAVTIDAWDREHLVALGFHHFVRARRDPRRAPLVARFFGLRLTFDEPVRGPMLLGYASHFGLGIFEGAS